MGSRTSPSIGSVPQFREPFGIQGRELALNVVDDDSHYEDADDQVLLRHNGSGQHQHSQEAKKAIEKAKTRIPKNRGPVPGLGDPNEKQEKGLLKNLAYRVLASEGVVSRNVAKRGSEQWGRDAAKFHFQWHQQLEAGLARGEDGSGFTGTEAADLLEADEERGLPGQQAD